MLSLQVRAKVLPPTHKSQWLLCSHPGCKVLRASSTPAEDKPYCSDHVEEMPYVQDMLRRMRQTDLTQDRRDTEAKWQALCAND